MERSEIRDSGLLTQPRISLRFIRLQATRRGCLTIEESIHARGMPAHGSAAHCYSRGANL
jgi:hypothetical protein